MYIDRSQRQNTNVHVKSTKSLSNTWTCLIKYDLCWRPGDDHYSMIYHCLVLSIDKIDINTRNHFIVRSLQKHLVSPGTHIRDTWACTWILIQAFTADSPSYPQYINTDYPKTRSSTRCVAKPDLSPYLQEIKDTDKGIFCRLRDKSLTVGDLCCWPWGIL